LADLKTQNAALQTALQAIVDKLGTGDGGTVTKQDVVDIINSTQLSHSSPPVTP